LKRIKGKDGGRVGFFLVKVDLKVEGGVDGRDAVLFCDFCRAQLFLFFLLAAIGGRKEFLFMCDAFSSSVYFVRHATPLPETTTARIMGDIYLSNNYRV
jgi:hypothetical protein